MDVIYLIEDSESGLKYIGSKKNWEGEDSYWGSLCCKNKKSKKYNLQKQWKENFLNHKETFSFNILDLMIIQLMNFYYPEKNIITKNTMF
jgi:hypothetical protein